MKIKNPKPIPTIAELRALRTREIAAARRNFHVRVQKAKESQRRFEAETAAAIARMARDVKAAKAAQMAEAQQIERNALMREVVKLARSGVHHPHDIATQLNISPSLARALYRQVAPVARPREIRIATNEEARLLRNMYKPSKLAQLGVQLPDRYRDADDDAWFRRQHNEARWHEPGWPNEYTQNRSALNDLAIIVGFLETNQIGLEVALGDPSLTSSDPSPVTP